MRFSTFRVVLPVTLIFAAACGDSDDPVNPVPQPATIPIVSGMYSISNTNADPSCDAALPAEVLDGPATSPGQMEVKQNAGAVDMEITELDGLTFTAAQADSSSLVGTIDTTGTGMLTRTLDFQDTANDSTVYFISQDIAGTVAFTVNGTARNFSSTINFTSEYRPDSATAPLLATCTTTGTITGNSL